MSNKIGDESDMEDVGLIFSIRIFSTPSCVGGKSKSESSEGCPSMKISN